MPRRITIHILLALLVAALPLPASAADPQLTTILPRGAQRGTEIRVTLTGARLADAADIIFYSPGIELRSIESAEDNRVEAVLAITPDCALGLHGLRVRTRTGISNLRTFSVGALPEISETEPNGDPNAIEAVEPDVTINGRITSEDQDYFAFNANAGDVYSIEIEGIRLGDALFDPFIALQDENGFVIASCDDHPLLRQDACVTAQIPRDGLYTVQVRESAHRGSGLCHYRLHIGRFPRPLGLSPAGAPPGEPTGVTWLGAAGSSMITLAAGEPESHLGWTERNTTHALATVDGRVAPSPNPVRLSNLPNIVETESQPPAAVAAPAAFHGIIAADGETDRYTFTARSGQSLDCTVFARRLGSPLDAVLTIADAAGKQLAANDDAGGPDSALRFTPPADGEYVLAIRDHLGKGGATYAYRVEVAPPSEYATLAAPRNRQAVAVPQGANACIVLAVERAEFDAPLTLRADDLPPGVSVTVPPVPAGATAVPVVFHAAPEAELAHGLTRWSITRADGDAPVPGGFRQEIEQVLGRNNVVFWAHTVERLPVAVTEQPPFSITLDPPAAPLVQNGSSSLRVTVTRREGFAGAVRLSVPFLSPGVSANQSVSIPPEQTEAAIAINAGNRAATGEWPIVVVASAPTPGGEIEVSSAPATVRVASPFVAFSPQATSVERGGATAMLVEIQRLEGFAGEATVALGALPHNVTAEPLPLDASTESLTFEITTALDSPAGRHKGVFCTATFRTAEGEVVHRLPAGELIIQNPPPAPTTDAPAPPPPPPPPPTETKAKPLTRLEKLRLDHEQRLRELEASRAAEDGPSTTGGEDDPENGREDGQ